MINLGKPEFAQEEIDAVAEVIRSGWVGRGKQVELFEQEFAAYSGAKYAVAINGCTVGLFLSLKHLGIGPSDEVIVPSNTWNATAAVVVQLGATPVFADILPDTWCLDPDDVRKRITSKTKAVVPVHYAARFAYGFEKFPVPVIYDSAHRMEPLGFPGVTSVHSFYVTKNITTVRGGMILTNDLEEAEWYRMMRTSGIRKDVLKRYAGGDFHYEVEDPSWNFDMSDVEAAIGRAQLKKIGKFEQRRNEIVARYNEAFGLRNSGNHLYPITVDNRNEVIPYLKEQGIQAGVHYFALHLMKGYAKYRTEKLPVTEFFSNTSVSLPIYSSLELSDVDKVIEAVQASAKFISYAKPEAQKAGAEKKTRVSVGIPVYNEEANILYLLKRILEQDQDGFNLEEIIVISDGSTDSTTSLVRQLNHPKVRLIDSPQRLGQQARQNELLRLFSGDVLAILEGDILPYNQRTLAELITPFHTEGQKPDMVVGSAVPIEPQTFFERIMVTGDAIKKGAFQEWKDGMNVYACGGHCMKAISRNFAEKLQWPLAVPEDSYTYFRLKELNMVFVRNPEAKAYMRHVTNFRDRIRQCTKFVSGRRALEQYFRPELVAQDYDVPFGLMLKHMVRGLIRKPVLTVLYAGEVALNRLVTITAKRFNHLYNPYTTSKTLGDSVKEARM